MTLPEAEIRRLAFVRYLYRMAEENSGTPEPMACASLLLFHDALELFLQLACEHLNSVRQGKKEPDFMEYFAIVNKSLEPGVLAQTESMRRLNKARVALKHHGIMPSKTDIEGFKYSSFSFFQENTPVVFGVAFDELSLADLIADENCRDHLRQAEKDLAAGQFADSLENSAIAFAFLCARHEIEHEGKGTLAHKAQDYEFHTLGNRSPTRSALYEIAKVVDSLVQEAGLLRMGIDPQRLSVFRAITPAAWIMHDNKIRLGYTRDRNKQLSAEEVRFACNFVVESAVQVQEATRLSTTLAVPRRMLSINPYRG